MDPLIIDSDIKIFPNAKASALALAENFMQRSIAAVQKKNEFTVALSGGSTPKLLFDILRETAEYRNQIPWGKIKFFFGDERYLPQDDPNTNYNMANSNLFSKLPISTHNIYQISTESVSPVESALEYQAVLKKQLPHNAHNYPEFDLVYLGLGEDAHTASLMPNSNVVKFYSQKMNQFNDMNNHAAIPNLVVAIWVPKLNMYRITLTPIAINNALTVIFMVNGTNKASAVHEVLEENNDPENYPAQLIRCVNSPNIWYLDEAAASQLIIRPQSQ